MDYQKLDGFPAKFMWGGSSSAFQCEGAQYIDGKGQSAMLSALFPTGHAFGITMASGVEILVHIGINTVEEKGHGFRVLGKSQGDYVKAGDPIVKVNIAGLGKKYDMSTMLIITNANKHKITFTKPGDVKK